MGVREISFGSKNPVLMPFNLVWRIVVGVSLVPAFGTLYQRLTLPEAKRYEEAHQNDADPSNDCSENLKQGNYSISVDTEKTAGQSESNGEGSHNARELAVAKKSHLGGEYAD